MIGDGDKRGGISKRGFCARRELNEGKKSVCFLEEVTVLYFP